MASSVKVLFEEEKKNRKRINKKVEEKELGKAVCAVQENFLFFSKIKQIILFFFLCYYYTSQLLLKAI
jgi:hypothetical protein